ncbi:MFS transporter [Aminobacter sp. MSH1]|uniref:MFS transporter n=2 Tax=Aminobacter TaxID=31988 RepID=UPI00131F338E|nr:MFS transporter [Aminobacter sp. MSH1]
MEPIEQATGAGRLAVSLVYSAALLSLTAAVFFGHKLYRRFNASSLVLLAAALPILGIPLTLTGTWAGWIVGYGLLFGFASGAGYGFALHSASFAVPAHRRGLAIGATTAFYGLGAFGFSLLYPALLAALGLAAGYAASTIIVAGLASVSATLFFASRLTTNVSIDEPNAAGSSGGLLRLWLGYGMGAFAGLLVLGHAVPIILASGNSTSAAIAGLAMVSLGNAMAGLCAGLIADRFGSRRPLVVVATISAIALAGLTYTSDPQTTVALIGTVGATYGAFIALYPLLVSTWSGADRAAWAYGRVFTAWGLAGVAAQPVAGWLYEVTGQYYVALTIACLFSLGAAAIIAFVGQDRNEAFERVLGES